MEQTLKTVFDPARRIFNCLLGAWKRYLSEVYMK